MSDTSENNLENLIDVYEEFQSSESELDKEFIQIISGNRFPILSYINIIVGKLNVDNPEFLVDKVIREAYITGKEMMLIGKTIERPRYWFKHTAAKILLEFFKKNKQENQDYYNEFELNACINIIDCQGDILSDNQHKDLVIEYYKLIKKINLSNYESERLTRLIQASESNNALSVLFNEIDYFVAQSLGIIEKQFTSEFQEKQKKTAETIMALLETEKNSNLKGKLKTNIPEFSKLLDLDEKERLEVILQKQESGDFLHELTPEHKKLASEYYHLLTMSRLTDDETDRLCEILEFLQSDNSFRFLCDVIDNSVIREGTLLDDSRSRNQLSC